jgi:alkylhydroperoxidase family enzyme
LTTAPASAQDKLAIDCQTSSEDAMARISYVDPDSITDPELAGYLEDSRRYGTPRLESQAIRAHVPAVLRSFNQSWQNVFRTGVLDHDIKELARVFVAKSLDCGYCAGQRSHLADISEREVDELIEFRNSDRFTDREKAALLLAEAIAWEPSMADDEVWAQLHEHFTEPEIVELGYFIGLTMGQQKFLKTLGIKHGDLGRDNTAGLAPEVAAALK